ncbi:MAG: hypothetical protein Kow0058_08370 [Roseovarius sp.]
MPVPPAQPAVEALAGLLGAHHEDLDPAHRCPDRARARAPPAIPIPAGTTARDARAASAPARDGANCRRLANMAASVARHFVIVKRAAASGKGALPPRPSASPPEYLQSR